MSAVLNLIYPERGDIGFTINHFPDGHKHIKLHSGFNKHRDVIIKCRITNGDDLFILEQLYAIFTHEEIDIQKIHIYYLFTARCDRRFSLGEAPDLEIVFEKLYHMNTSFVLYDLHSEAILNKYYRDRYDTYVHYALSQTDIYKYYQVCFPDRGAYERLYFSKHAPLTNFQKHIYAGENRPMLCTKERDPETGYLFNFDLQDEEFWTSKYPAAIDKPIMVIDDLCDGGGTFIGIHTLLKTIFQPPKIALFITHAIQKEGIEKVARVYDEVVITNSYKNWEMEKLPENVTVIDIVG